MFRRTMLLAAVAVLAAAGCRYCASPYDYCGPLFTGRDCTPCAPDSRAGSIYSDQVIPLPSYGPEMMELGSDESQPVPDQVASVPVKGPAPGVGQAAAATYHEGPSPAAPRLFQQPSRQPHRVGGYSQPAPWLPQR